MTAVEERPQEGTPLALARALADAARQELEFWESLPGRWARRQARAARRRAEVWDERAAAAEQGRERAGWAR